MIRVGFRWLERGKTRHPEATTLRGGSLSPVDFPSLVGVIAHPTRGHFLFDTGYDPAFIAATEPFPERFYRWATPVSLGPQPDWQAWLAAHDIAEDSLSGLIVSHFHGDHVAGARHLAHLPFHCSRAGLSHLRQAGRFALVRKGMLPALVPPAMDAGAHFFEDSPEVALPSAFAPFTGGRDILGDGSLLAVELPGHCPGHWGMAFVDAHDRPVLLCADAVWSGTAIAQNRPPPRLTTALMGDTATYRGTLERLHQAATNGAELAILPSHCPASARAYRDAAD